MAAVVVVETLKLEAVAADAAAMPELARAGLELVSVPNFVSSLVAVELELAGAAAKAENSDCKH